MHYDNYNLHCVISIHALLAESDHPQKSGYPHNTISIHALLAESDSCTSIGRPKRLYFYPRSPCGERLSERVPLAESTAISIHALLAESDAMQVVIVVMNALFLSTLSLRRATAKVHKTVGHFCAYETNFMGIASSC